MCSCCQVGCLVCCDEVVFGHYVVDFLVESLLESQVAIGDDAFESSVVIDNGYAAYVILCHDVECVAHGAA